MSAVTELFSARQVHAWHDGMLAVRPFAIYPAVQNLEGLPLPAEGDAHPLDARLTCHTIVPWQEYRTTKAFAIYTTPNVKFHVRIEKGEAVVTRADANEVMPLPDRRTWVGYPVSAGVDAATVIADRQRFNEALDAMDAGLALKPLEHSTETPPAEPPKPAKKSWEFLGPPQ